MIKIVFPLSGLTPNITLQDTALTLVSSGTMAELGPTNDGRFWYGYSYTGIQGQEYRIIVDGGESILNSDERYYDEWGMEGCLSDEQHQRLYGTATKGDVSFSPAITFEEKQKIFTLLDTILEKPSPVLDISPLTNAIHTTNTTISGLAKKEDLQVHVTVAPDERIQSIVTAISGITPYLQPDANIERMAQTLDTISKRELDTEAIQSIHTLIKELPVEHIDEIKSQFMEKVKDSLQEIITQEIVKSFMKEQLGFLMDKIISGSSNVPLQDKLYDLWANNK